ncbi:hypothetical protein LINPERPRIM_LOCUS33840 [Linum perenne]
MDIDDRHGSTTVRSSETTSSSSSSSVLQGDGAFYNHVISRDSSVHCPSSRVFYCRSNADGVPFNWETQPGTPKNIPKEDSIPPINPPPAILSLALPKPSFLITSDRRAAAGSNAKKLKLLWKFLIGGKGTGKRRARYTHRHPHPQPQVRSLNNVDNSRTLGSGMSWDSVGTGDLVPNSSSPGGRNSSFSSSVLSHSSSNDEEDCSRLSTSNSDSSGIRSINSNRGSNDHHYHRGCGGGPWNFNSVLVCVSGKI